MDSLTSYRRRSGVGVGFLVLLLGTLPPSTAYAQIKSPMERLRDLEEANQGLQGRIEALEKELEGRDGTAPGQGDPSKDEPFFSDGMISLGGGVKLQVGGKLELNLVDPQSENDPVVGTTDNPDPHFEFDTFRLEPALLFSRRISVEGQIDFEPTRTGTKLKELTANYNLKRPAWWFDAKASLGLDDPFIRYSRRTEYYPEIGSAFWRRESLKLLLSATFGDRNGPPQTEDLASDSVVIVRKRSPFDFLWNPGEAEIFFSVGNGYELDFNEINKDRARFNDMVINDRDLTSNLSIRELGVGLKYSRNFDWLGELELLGFYYNDELSDDSVQFLQNELTLRAGGVVTAGYGDSAERESELYGAGVEYFLPLRVFFDPSAAIRAGDGLRVAAQWMQGTSGDLRRRGWYVQGSYRFSFPESVDPDDGSRSRGLIARRYLRSLEPIVRYGTFDINVDPVPQLPGLWDRQSLFVGLRVEVTSEVWLRLEYAFNWEDTGASAAFPGPKSVDNNELLVQLRLDF